MANQEHLDILKQGVEVWNKWRKEYPKINPDLSFFNLTLIDIDTWSDFGGGNFN